ncbi:MAG: integrase/recombinase XerD, partial [Verrucomicrobiales bacterium]
MPKRTDFPIRKVEGRAKPWVIDVPPRYSESGKRERWFFATSREAEHERARLKKMREEHGASVRSLPPAVTDEAATAIRILKPTGATLLEVAREYLETWNQRQQSMTFAELWSRERDGESIQDLADRSKEQIFYIGRKILPLLGEKLVADISTEELEAVLSQICPTESSRKACIRVISKVFKRAVALDYCQRNPLDGVSRPKSQELNPEILSPTQSKRLLDTCAELDAELVPFFAIGLFAGIRPDELKRLTWLDVEFSENHIRIVAANSKTRTRRFVDLESNLIEWLLPFRKAEGKVAPERNFRKRFDTVRKEAELFDCWQSDILRHSYCSHWLAAF